MIRVVCDINVLVSGFTHTSRPIARIIRAWLAGVFILVVSDHLIDGVAAAFTKPYFAARLSSDEVIQALTDLTDLGEMTTLSRTVSGVAPDAEDDLVLSTALSGDATYLVTGDRRFRQLGGFETVTLLTPTEFLAVLDR